MAWSPLHNSPNLKAMKTGETWQYVLYFDPEADKPARRQHIFPDSELLMQMTKFTANINVDKQITNVQVYTASHETTFSGSIMNFVRDYWQQSGHIFLVFKVGEVRWWSLEMTQKGITIQQSESIDGVTKFCRGEERKNVNGPLHDNKESSRKAMPLRDFFSWLHYRCPSLRDANCYKFASEMFQFFTGTQLRITKSHVCGNELTSDVYFNPEADKNRVSPKYLVKHEKLTQLLRNFLDADEQIKKVIAFKLPLKEDQWIATFFYHLIIVFETEEWWWSIEKNNEGLTVQRSKNLDAVKENYRQNPRLKRTGWLWHWDVIEEMSDRGNKTIKQLITWLITEKWLSRTYHWTRSNCQHFGKAVFDYVAAKKRLSVATQFLNED